MYPPPPPKHVPEPVPAIVEPMPLRTPEQAGVPSQFDFNSPQPVIYTVQQPPEPEKSEPSILKAFDIADKGINDIGGPFAKVLEKEGEAKENLEKGKASREPGYADHPPDEPSPEQEPASEQSTAPKQAEAAAPDENVENSNASEAASAGSSDPPEPTKETTKEQEPTSNEDINNIEEPVTDAYKKKGEAEESVDKSNALPVYAGSSDPPEPSQKSDGESGSSTPSADDGYDHSYGMGQ